MKKFLPLGNPYLDTYSKYGALTSILDIHENTEFWVYHLFFNPTYARIRVEDISWCELRPCTKELIWSYEWDMCPYIKSTKVKTSDIPKGEFTEFAMEQISKGRYVYLDVGKKEIEEYGHKKGNHDLLISGYDKTEKQFLCSDYFQLKYERKMISFDAVNRAYELKRNQEIRNDYNFIWEYQDAADDSSTLEKFVEQLHAMLDAPTFFSHNSITGEDIWVTSGIRIYENLKVDFLSRRVNFGDARFLCIIKNHFEMFINLVNKYNLDENKNTLNELYNKVNNLIMLSIKCRMDESVSMRIKMIELLDYICEVEKNYIEHLLKNVV